LGTVTSSSGFWLNSDQIELGEGVGFNYGC